MPARGTARASADFRGQARASASGRANLVGLRVLLLARPPDAPSAGTPAPSASSAYGHSRLGGVGVGSGLPPTSGRRLALGSGCARFVRIRREPSPSCTPYPPNGVVGVVGSARRPSGDGAGAAGCLWSRASPHRRECTGHPRASGTGGALPSTVLQERAGTPPVPGPIPSEGRSPLPPPHSTNPTNPTHKLHRSPAPTNALP